MKLLSSFGSSRDFSSASTVSLTEVGVFRRGICGCLGLRPSPRDKRRVTVRTGSASRVFLLLVSMTAECVALCVQNGEEDAYIYKLLFEALNLRRAYMTNGISDL